MIFVTVGTHEQQFNRLVKYIDELKGSGKIEEDVVIQTGYSTYEPVNCQWSKFFTYDEMNDYVGKARIIITHGGPSSFIAALQVGKIPIVVPRQTEFDEHVNNHQVDFCEAVQKRHGNILVVKDIIQLGNTIKQYDELVDAMPTNIKSNNAEFCRELERIVGEVLKR